jgi:hypothetical protein
MVLEGGQQPHEERVVCPVDVQRVEPRLPDARGRPCELLRDGGELPGRKLVDDARPGKDLQRDPGPCGVAALDQGAEGSAKAGVRPIRHPTRGGLGGDDESHPTLGAAHVECTELGAAPVPGQVEGGQDDAVAKCQLAVDREGIEEHGSFSSRERCLLRVQYSPTARGSQCEDWHICVDGGANHLRNLSYQEVP